MERMIPVLVIIIPIAIVCWLLRAAGRKSGRSHGRSAAELMKRVQELQSRNAQWPQIQESLGVSEILMSIRGPHLFAPHVALNVIRHGCEVALRKNPGAGWWHALNEAKASMERVTRFGD
jgi:hypothetical protein